MTRSTQAIARRDVLKFTAAGAAALLAGAGTANAADAGALTIAYMSTCRRGIRPPAPLR